MDAGAVQQTCCSARDSRFEAGADRNAGQTSKMVNAYNVDKRRFDRRHCEQINGKALYW
jgi:hypothetical protein